MPDEPIKQDCEEIAEQAWEATREAGDPSWADAVTTHRERLLYTAQSVKRSKLASTPFEKAVAKLLKPAKAAEPDGSDSFGGLTVHDDGGAAKSPKKKAATVKAK